MVQPQRHCRSSGVTGGRIPFPILFSCTFGKAGWIWNAATPFGCFRTQKSRCAEAPAVSGETSALAFPSWIPKPSERWRARERWGKCTGPGSSGCMFAQAAADSRRGDVAGATPAASRACIHKRAGARSCQHQASHPQQHQALIY